MILLEQFTQLTQSNLMCPPSLDDLPTLATVSTSGDDLIPVYDLMATGSSKVRKLALNSVLGLDPAGTISSSAALTFTVVNRVTVLTGGTTCTLTFPAASGVLREVIIINANSGTATAPTLAAGALPILTAISARFLSNGTGWYRVG